MHVRVRVHIYIYAMILVSADYNHIMAWHGNKTIICMKRIHTSISFSITFKLNHEIRVYIIALFYFCWIFALFVWIWLNFFFFLSSLPSVFRVSLEINLPSPIYRHRKDMSEHWASIDTRLLNVHEQYFKYMWWLALTTSKRSERREKRKIN